jgi:hypothetical protein
MATRVTPQNLTVTISTAITLNGNQRNTEHQLVIPSINEYDSRLMTLPLGSEVVLVSFGSVVGAGTFIRGDLKHFQVSNLDTVNYARIRVKKNGADTFDQRLEAGQTFMTGNAKESVSATAASFATFVEADSISMEAYVAPIDVEYVVAAI